MITTIAIILLIMRLVSLGFICLVLYRQLRLFRLDIDSGLVHFRVFMFILGIVLFLGNLLPVLVDYTYAFIIVEDDFSLLVLYAISNASTSLAASIILYHIYKIAGTALDEEQKKHDQEK